MHVETYPDFFTPRDEEPSLSSSEEESSEFDWLEIKERENKNIYEQQSKCSVFYFLPKLYKRCVPENKLPRSDFKENYKLYRWITRRLWGFRHQISKEKYLKMSVAHIGKL